MKTFALSCVIALFCASCANTQTIQHSKANAAIQAGTESGNTSYSRAQNAISLGQYSLAIEHFTTLIQDFPTDKRVSHAILGIAYAHYKLGDIDSSVAITSKFIGSHKNHLLLDYAFYLHGLARYSAGIEQLQKDQLVGNNHDYLAREAFDSFSQVVGDYPNSRYREDSRSRMEVLFNNLAEHELVLAKNALKQDKYHEAIARSEHITKHYARTTAAQEAVAVMIDALAALGKPTKAESSPKSLTQKPSDSQHPDHGQDS